MNISSLVLALALVLLSLLLPLAGLPDWLPLLGATLAAILIYWVLNNPAEEFLVVQGGRLSIKDAGSHRSRTLPLAEIAKVRPLPDRDGARLELLCTDGSQLLFVPFHDEVGEDELRELRHFLRQHLGAKAH
ncbi:hypothetical protein PVT67_12585 [Gallaecimonas kandeliae]|uniref:hypothetical protein n=1 Tax=Gallaecimonas kandeliae TaxID=3029055 RepID=UPI00264995DE|nr:hypothetical protein [Gallaecimonas kandeliae]WKE64502.1 hypothetical protein PVT67_12585 [Gallaecimonas kandeliae]